MLFRDVITAFLICVTLMLVGYCTQPHAATTILPPGVTCFQQASGPVSSGSVYMLVPGTTTTKNTYQDTGQTILNTNPIQLDANGCALIYGTGSYRQQVYTGPVSGGLPTGLLLYDVVTADTSSFQNVFWAGLSGGTPNVITVTDPGFNATDGSVINFIALNTNTGSATLTPSGTGIAKLIETPSPAGPVAISSGCIAANNPVSVVWSSSANAFLLLTPCQMGSTSVAAVAPGGYLTLSNDPNNVILSSDATAAITVYYSPYVSNQVPIWNGSAFTINSFAQLALTLNASAHNSNTIYDVCVFLNNGTPTLATGPAWAVSTAGSGSRGTGGGSAQILRLNGLWVNAVQITGVNGASTFTIPAEQCTYVGSILIDGSAGQVSDYVSFGQNRKWGTWNAYNRQQITLLVGDSTANWTYNSVAYRSSNGAAGNAATAFMGLAEDAPLIEFTQLVQIQTTASGTFHIGVGVNATTPTSNLGKLGTQFINAAGGTSEGQGQDLVAVLALAPFIGQDLLNCIESGAASTPTFNGTQANMLMTVRYRG